MEQENTVAQELEQSENTSSTEQKFVAFFSGAGIGLLIGVIMGLAVSPTVGTIIGALSSSLVLLLGLNDKHHGGAKGYRLGAFGFACAFGAFLGMFVRTNNLLSPTINDMKVEYLEAGYTEQEALQFIAYREFGILEESWKMAGVITAPPPAEPVIEPVARESEPVESDEEEPEGKEAAADVEEETEPVVAAAPPPQAQSPPQNYVSESLVQRKHASVLFSSEVDESVCFDLEEIDELDYKFFISELKATGDIWKELAINAQSTFPEDEQKAILLTIKNAICASGSASFTDEQCAMMAKIEDGSGVDAYTTAFEKADGPWKALANAIQSQVAEGNQLKTYRLVIQSICTQ